MTWIRLMRFCGAFSGIAAVQPYYAASVRLEALTEVAFLEAVSGDYFSVLEVEMELGRGLAATDDRPAADPASPCHPPRSPPAPQGRRARTRGGPRAASG